MSVDDFSQIFTSSVWADPNYWEISAGGDYRRQQRQAGDADPNFWGGAGAPHVYDFQKKNAQGTWDFVNPGEHNEAADYFWAGLNAPGYLTALQKAEKDRSALDMARLSTPGALGQALLRSEASLTGGSNEDDWRQELAFYTGTPSQKALSQYMTPEMQTQIHQQLNDSSASAQSARASSDDGFGDIANLAMLAAAIYSGGAALGAWGGAGAAAGTGAASGAGLGALGSGTLGVELGGLGLYGTTPIMAGGLGSGLAGTSLASLGLDAAALGALGAGAAGLEGAGAMDLGSVVDWYPNVAEEVARPGWLDSLVTPIENQNLTYAPWASADPSLPFGSEEWLRSAGQGATMANGQTINLPEWIADNPVAARAVGATAPGFFERLLSSTGGDRNAASAIAKALGLGDTAAGIAGLLPKLLSGLDLVRRNREALSTNDARLREAKDNTPLAPSSWNMLRRAKGGLAQCSACSDDQGNGDARYVSGGTSGQADKIPALLSDGEYVFDADVVSALGDGNNAAGAAALDRMRENIRRQKRAAPVSKIPPKAKAPEHYLKGAK